MKIILLISIFLITSCNQIEITNNDPTIHNSYKQELDSLYGVLDSVQFIPKNWEWQGDTAITDLSTGIEISL